MSDDIVTRLRNSGDHKSPMAKGLTFKVRFPIMLEAADEIERLRVLAKALYDETRRCGSKHDVKATNDWENYDEAVRGE